MSENISALSHLVIILSLIFVVYRQGQIRRNGTPPRRHEKDDFPPL